VQIYNSTVCDSDLLVTPEGARVRMGMIGFDIACKTARSGSRIQGYLVNDLWKK
jgi:hypothetical protein